MKKLIYSLFSFCFLFTSCIQKPYEDKFQNETEIINQIIDDLKTPENFRGYSDYMSWAYLVHKEKSYSIISDNDICPGYTLICNDKSISEFDCDKPELYINLYKAFEKTKKQLKYIEFDFNCIKE